MALQLMEVLLRRGTAMVVHDFIDHCAQGRTMPPQGRDFPEEPAFRFCGSHAFTALLVIATDNPIVPDTRSRSYP